MEKIMRNICLNGNECEYIALNQTYYFWHIFDLLHIGNKADIFKHIYLTPARLNDTFLKISLEYGISLRTLERYRKEFVASYIIISSLIKKIKDISKAV